MIHAGPNRQSQLQPVHGAEEVASQAVAEEADQRQECFAQSSMEAVPQPVLASHIPVRVR